MFGWLGTEGAGGAGGGDGAGALICGWLGIAGGDANGAAGNGLREAGGAGTGSANRCRYAGPWTGYQFGYQG